MNTKGGSFTILLTSCLTGLDKSVLQIIVSSHTGDSKLVKQEVNCTVILPPLVFPAVEDSQERSLFEMTDKKGLYNCSCNPVLFEPRLRDSCFTFLKASVLNECRK